MPFKWNIHKSLIKDSSKNDANYTNGLRPLGNKKRLTHATDEDDYDAKILLFRDKGSAETYYNLFINHAKKLPPPYLIEIMLVLFSKSIFPQKYAVAIPNGQSDNRTGYDEWAMNTIRSCNDTLRVHNSTDHKYKELHNYLDVVYKWDILVPKNFSETSNEAKELLRDDPNEEYPPLKHALVRIGDERAVEPLILALKDEDINVRLGAVEALVEIRDARAVEPLCLTLNDKDAGVRRRAAKALGEIGDARAVEPLIQALKDTDADVLEVAADALVKIGKSAVEPLIQALKTGDTYMLIRTAYVLGEIGDGRAAEQLTLALRVRDDRVQNNAFYALVKIGKSAVEPLILALKDSAARGPRYWAAKALVRIGDERAVEPLILALKDEDINVRSQAREALDMIKLRTEEPSSEYSSEAWSFSLKYPSKWEKIYVSEREPVGSWSKPICVAGKSNSYGRPSFMVNVYRGRIFRRLADGRIIDMPRTPKEYIEIKKTDLSKSFRDYEFISGKETQVAGNPAASLVYSYEGELCRFQEESITVFCKGITFQFICEAPEDNFIQYAPVFKRIMETFKSK